MHGNKNNYLGALICLISCMGFLGEGDFVHIFLWGFPRMDLFGIVMKEYDNEAMLAVLILIHVHEQTVCVCSNL